MKYQMKLVAVTIPEYTRFPPTVGIKDPRFVRSIVSAVQPTSDPPPTIVPAVVDSAVKPDFSPEVPHNVNCRDPRKPWLRQGPEPCTPEAIPSPLQLVPNILIQQHLPTNDLPITFKMITISNDPISELMVPEDSNEKCRLGIS